MLKEASTITDLHNSSDNTEVHLISLVTDQIPKYRLRAESPSGYYQQDWLQTPILSQGADAEISPELYEQTFQYFILSGDRLSQMTQTYHDIEAVTNLLEEKERDLELAARIGQTLLQKNREAEQYSEQLEEQLQNALDQVSQLKHEINLKENLLHSYANDESDSSSAPSPVKEFRRLGSAGMWGQLEGLETKIKSLEVDNDQLRSDKAQYEYESEELETHEHELVSDALDELDDLRKELKNARDCNSVVTEELSLKTDETVRLQEEVTRLLTQVVDMQRKQKQVALENEELQQHLLAANSAQLDLTKEIQMLEDQYEELANALNESREEARSLRENQSNEFAEPIPFSDSLAAELEFDSKLAMSAHEHMESSRVTSDVSCEEKSPGQGAAMDTSYKDNATRTHSQRAFDTVKFVKSFGGPAEQFKTPNRQVRPIPTPFPLSCKVNSNTASVARNSNTTPESGNSTRYLGQNDGRQSILGFQSAEKSHKHATMDAKRANFMPSPYVKLPARLHALSPLHRSAVQSGNEVNDLPIELKSQLTRKLLHANHSKNPSGTTPSLGRPGVPGTEDLEKAIRKLALRRESSRYIQFERYRGLNTGSDSTLCSVTKSELSMIQSASSGLLSSSLSSELSTSKVAAIPVKPPKLRIVKPLEGSVTLNQWKYLAGKDRTLQLSSDTKCDVLTRDRVIDVKSTKVAKSDHMSTTQKRSSGSSKLANLLPQANSIHSDGHTLDKVLANTRRVNAILKPCQDSVSRGNAPKICMSPGKKFAFTPTKYTYAYSNVKNPDDAYDTIPSTSAPGSTMSPKHSSPISSNSSIYDLEFSSSSRKIIQKENTRTCSIEFGIAQLLKEHGAKSMNEQVNPSSVRGKEGNPMCRSEANEKRMKFSAVPANAGRGELNGPLVWNRTLKRSFLLSTNSMCQGFASKTDKTALSAKPETPPNSPTREFNGNFPFINDGYLQSDDEEAGQSSNETPSRATTNNFSEGKGESADEFASSTPTQRAGENGVRNPDWSELHGSSGALCASFDECVPPKTST